MSSTIGLNKDASSTEETLFTAARRVRQWLNIDMAHGGLISEKSEWALLQLDKQLEKETARRKQLAAETTP